jgi:hypothetical protein
MKIVKEKTNLDLCEKGDDEITLFGGINYRYSTYFQGSEQEIVIKFLETGPFNL